MIRHDELLFGIVEGMVHEITRMGYCSICDQNILHVRRAVSGRSWWIELATLKLSRFLGQGPWQCCQCDQPSRFLNPSRDQAPTHHQINPDSDGQTDGNFIRRDQSLILQKQRAARFSQKYRDGVVQRLASGSARVNQVCRELEISEADVMAWIADLLKRREEKIGLLESLIAEEPETKPGNQRIEDLAKSNQDGICPHEEPFQTGD